METPEIRSILSLTNAEYFGYAVSELVYQATDPPAVKENIISTYRPTPVANVRRGRPDWNEIPCTKNLQNIIKRTPKINTDFKKYSDIPAYTMPLIIMHYGPYECNGVIRHRPQKLYGLTGKYTFKLFSHKN